MRTFFSEAEAGRMVGLRYYELSDHLGNVLATVLDRKTGHYPGYGLYYDYWTADVASAQDYYPFGMEIPGRTYVASIGLGSKFGFNGQQRSDEVYGKGNSVEFKFRGYDVRIGRFRSVDPLAGSYPWNSTYAFAENCPIGGVDLEGLELLPVNSSMYRMKYLGSTPALGRVDDNYVTEVVNSNIPYMLTDDDGRLKYDLGAPVGTNGADFSGTYVKQTLKKID